LRNLHCAITEDRCDPAIVAIESDNGAVFTVIVALPSNHETGKVLKRRL
jgi:hypothetical protein